MPKRLAAVAGLVLLAALAAAVTGCGSGSSSATGSTSSSTAASPAPPSSPAPPAGGHGESLPEAGIEHYGAAAGGGTKVTVAAAAHSFFTAMANGDYPALCADLAALNRRQLREFLKARVRSTGCAGVLKTLLTTTAAAEARKAASAAVTAVRIKGNTAFVLFRPKGGAPSYFVMKKEGGAWKATSLGPGAPIEFGATP